MDKLLKKFNLNYEDLNTTERETLMSWYEQLSKKDLTTTDVKNYIATMKESVETELVNEPEFIYIFIFKIDNRKQILLKARLRNYMLIESFLTTPEKAKKALETQINALAREKEAKK